MRKKIIALIFGGRSQEHAVSVKLALDIFSVLSKNKKYKIVPVGITKSGRWVTGKNVIQSLQKGIEKDFDTVTVSLNRDKTFYFTNAKGKVTKIKIDVAFPWMPGPFGEDGSIQGLLELVDIPYVGSGVFASACGFDKLATKKFLQAFNIPQVGYVSFSKKEWQSNQKKCLDVISKKIIFPAFVKPVSCGSSIGVSKVHSRKDLKIAFADAFKYDAMVIIENGVPNALDIECAILEGEPLTVSIPGQVMYEGEFYDYTAKYVSKKWDVLIPPALPRTIIERVRLFAIDIFMALNIAGGARFDFLVDKKTKEIYFNEVNTAPNLRADSMFTRLLATQGLTYAQILEKFISSALMHHRSKEQR